MADMLGLHAGISFSIPVPDVITGENLKMWY